MSSVTSAVTPFQDHSRRRRLTKVLAWLVGIALVLVVLNLLGIYVVGWLQDLWDQIKEVPTGYIRYVDSTNRLVYINLGSADKLPLRTTFAVYAKSNSGVGRGKEGSLHRRRGVLQVRTWRPTRSPACGS